MTGMPLHDDTHGQPIATCSVCEAAAARYEETLAAPHLLANCRACGKAYAVADGEHCNAGPEAA